MNEPMPLGSTRVFVISSGKNTTLAVYRGCDAEIWRRDTWEHDFILEVYWHDGDVIQSSWATVEDALEHFKSIVDAWHESREQ